MTGKQLPSGPTSVTVRVNVEIFRSELGMTYAALSRELERRGHPIPPLGLRRIESGDRRVDVDDLMALALALGVNPNALLLPVLKGSEVAGRLVTGSEKSVSSRQAWDWAIGSRPLTYPDGDVSAFRTRVRPVEVLTDVERASRRSTWMEAERLRRQQERDAPDGQREYGGRWNAGNEDPAQDSEYLDPRDDAAWALQDFDPAPPLTIGPHA